MSYDFNVNGRDFRLVPDAGWNTNLGEKAYNMDVLAYSKIQNLPQPVKDKFISDMAQNVHNEKNVVNLINKTIKRGYKSRGEELPLTWFTPNIIRYLEKNNIRLKTPVVVFEDRQVKHSLGERKVLKQRLTETQFLKISEYIKNPDEILLDTEQLAIIYVKFLPKNEIIDNKDCIKIPVEININNPKRPINYIGTTARVNYKSSLNHSRYKKIE